MAVGWCDEVICFGELGPLGAWALAQWEAERDEPEPMQWADVMESGDGDPARFVEQALFWSQKFEVLNGLQLNKLKLELPEETVVYWNDRDEYYGERGVITGHDRYDLGTGLLVRFKGSVYHCRSGSVTTENPKLRKKRLKSIGPQEQQQRSLQLNPSKLLQNLTTQK